MASRFDIFTGTAGSAINGRVPTDGLSAWVCVNGGTIQGNAFAHSGGSPEVNYLECSTTDVNIIATVTAVPSAFGKMGFVTRVVDSSNYWYAQIRAGSTAGAAGGLWTIVKRVATSDTTVASATGPAIAIGDIVRLNVSADRLRLYYTPIATGVESLLIDTGVGQTFNQTATKHGLGGAFEDAGSRWDNLAINDLLAAATTYSSSIMGAAAF